MPARHFYREPALHCAICGRDLRNRHSRECGCDLPDTRPDPWAEPHTHEDSE